MDYKSKKMLQDKKGQGLVSGIIAGISALVILTIVTFLIISTMNGADLIDSDTATTSQNGITFTDAGTDLTSCAAETNGVIGSITVINASGGETIPSTNYTTSGCTLTTIGAGSVYNATSVNVSSYAYTYDADEQVSTDQMISNFTSGVNNVSNKLPTILLVAAVVILFGAIVLLVKQSQQISGNSSGL